MIGRVGNDELTAFAVISDGPDCEPDFAASYREAACMTAGRWIVGVTSWREGPLWIDTILLGHERFVIRPRVRVSAGRTVWINLDGWPGTPYERRWPVLDIDPAAFTEHVLSNPMDWLRDDARQDMRRILGGGRQASRSGGAGPDGRAHAEQPDQVAVRNRWTGPSRASLAAAPPEATSALGDEDV
jgi:hypothetical protein